MAEAEGRRETGRERTRRYVGAYRQGAARARVVGARTTQALPGTDTFGTVFKMLSIAGLLGLGILHPEMVSSVLTKATGVIRTIITGANK